MGFKLSNRYPLSVIEFKQLFEQILQVFISFNQITFVWSSWIFCKIESFSTFKRKFLNYLRSIFVLKIKGKSFSEHKIKTYACWPNIDLETIAIFRIEFRCQIICNALDLKVSFFPFYQLGKTEIKEIKLVFLNCNGF